MSTSGLPSVGKIAAVARQDFQRLREGLGAWLRSPNFPVHVTAGVACVAIFTWAFLMERRIKFDDFGLANPVYTFVNYGEMSYPAHENYDGMYIHPPTHYYMIGLLMRLGVTAPYAEALPATIIMLVGLIVVVLGAFSRLAKIGLIAGVVGGTMLAWHATSGLSSPGMTRPDLALALAFVVGLIILEDARLRGWTPHRLFLGGAFLGFSTTLHYPALAAWLGGVIYAAWAIRILGRQDGVKPALATLLGTAVPLLIYGLGFILPNWSSVYPYLRSTEPLGSPIEAIGVHVDVLHGAYLFYLESHAASRILFLALLLKIPLVLISTLVLWRVKELRGMAIAGLPHLLFLLIFVKRKTTNFAYYLPEVIIYTIAVFVLLFHALGSIPGGRPGLRAKHSTKAAAAIACVAILVGSPWLGAVHWSIDARPDELIYARAAGKSMVGPDALVGARIGHSFIFGESHWVMINPSVLWRPVTDDELSDVFSKVDVIAEAPFLSYDTANGRNESLSSWYADGTLHLLGFYFSSRHNYPLSYLLLRDQGGENITGYATLDDWTVIRFDQSETGDFVFSSVVCNGPMPVDSSRAFIQGNSYLLPMGEHSYQRQVRTSIWETSSYASFKADLLSAGSCRVIDEIPLVWAEVDSESLIQALDGEPPIRFYRTLGEAVAGRRSVD